MDGCWWLRSPNPGNANNVRNVNPDGSLNNNNANNGNGAAPDCEKCPYAVVSAPDPARNEPSALTQGAPDLTFVKITEVNTYRRCSQPFGTGAAENAGHFYGTRF